MKFLADENIHGMIVQWLRITGHDVLWATESLRGQDDEVLLARALAEDRIIFTSDMDFGELVFNQQLEACGVLLMRMDDVPIQIRINRLAAVWPAVESQVLGTFVVITAQKIRVRRLPKP